MLTGEEPWVNPVSRDGDGVSINWRNDSLETSLSPFPVSYLGSLVSFTPSSTLRHGPGEESVDPKTVGQEPNKSDHWDRRTLNDWQNVYKGARPSKLCEK